MSSISDSDDSYRRDSYGHRICDDLSEVLLKYLSLKDRLKLECVSKQFQRTIYTRMKDIHFWSEFDCDEDTEYINLVKLARILKRFKKIKLFAGASCDIETSEVILNNHDNLVGYNFSGMSKHEPIEEKLIKKFGSNLKSITLYSFRDFSNDINPYLSQIPNIEHLAVDMFEPGLASVHFPKLNSFEVQHFGENQSEVIDVKLFDKFADNHCQTVTRLTLYARDLFGYDEFRQLMTSLAKFEHLAHFATGVTSFRINDPKLETELKRMAQKCKRLTSLGMCYAWNPQLWGTKALVDLSPLKQFPQLRRLDLMLFSSNRLTTKSLQGLPQELTHFSVYCSEGHKYSEELLTDIDKYLPNIKSFKVETRGKDGQFVATERTADILILLKRFETIRLQIMDESIRRLIRIKLSDNCKYIRDINLEPNEW